jgi:hypothetical protein
MLYGGLLDRRLGFHFHTASPTSTSTACGGMEKVTAQFPSNRMDKRRYATELFPCNEVGNVLEHFPSNRRYGEMIGESIGEIRDHSRADYYAVGKHVRWRHFPAKFNFYDLMPRCSSPDRHQI